MAVPMHRGGALLFAACAIVAMSAQAVQAKTVELVWEVTPTQRQVVTESWQSDHFEATTRQVTDLALPDTRPFEIRYRYDVTYEIGQMNWATQWAFFLAPIAITEFTESPFTQALSARLRSTGSNPPEPNGQLDESMNAEELELFEPQGLQRLNAGMFATWTSVDMPVSKTVAYERYIELAPDYGPIVDPNLYKFKSRQGRDLIAWLQASIGQSATFVESDWQSVSTWDEVTYTWSGTNIADTVQGVARLTSVSIVPEPDTLLLLATGLCGLFAITARRSRRGHPA